MKVLRIYSGDDGKSHFEDLDIPLKDLGHIGKLSKLQSATGIVFRTTEGDYEFGWHCAPRRLEVGSVLLAEDLTGQGHISRAVDAKPRTSIFVTLD